MTGSEAAQILSGDIPDMYLQHISAQRCPEPIKNMRGIVVHCISFHDKLTAYRGASDQFDLKLEITAYNAESKEEVKVVCQDDVKLFVRSRSNVSGSQCQVV